MAANAFVIVGGGVAAGKAIETLRDEGYDGDLVVVADEDVLPYERPPLTKGVLLGTDDSDVPILHDAQWYAERGVDVRTGVGARRLDPGARSVELADGSMLGYDKLLLATGARVKRLPVPGADLAGVQYMRTLHDSLNLLDVYHRREPVVVIGAGWIGLEAAAAARHHGCEVVVVEPAACPLGGPLGPEMGEVFADLHRDHGVEFRFGRQVDSIEGDDGLAHAVVLDDGARLSASVVVIGIGVTPNVELAGEAGLSLVDGVTVNAALQSSDPNIFAVGDVARWAHPTLGVDIRVEHWANAHDGGQAAARSMLGMDVSYDVLPFFYSDQYDLGMEFSGHIGPDGYDEVIVRGDQKAREFCAYWMRGDRMIAGMNVNVWDVQDDIQELIRAGASVADLP